MREAELLRPLLLEEIDIASEPEDEKILELIDRLILEEEVTRKLPVSRKTEVRRELFILCAGWMFCRNCWMIRK